MILKNLPQRGNPRRSSALRRFIAILLVFCVPLAFFPSLSLSMQCVAEKAAPAAPPSTYTAQSALLIEQYTGQILFEQNSNQRLAPASLTKIMVLILIMESIRDGQLTLDQKLTCSEYAKSMGGSEIWLKVGEQMTVDHLLKAVFVASANDASVVFAEAIASTEEGFVKQMNRKASEMGLKNTQFRNCTGFDEDGHYTSAADVAAMARELMNYDLVTKYSTIWMDTLRGGQTELVNTNRMIRFYQGATGLKTGTTDAAGHCLCATATRNGLSLISVIMGCKTGETRFEESKQLLDYGFTHYTIYQPEPIDSDLLPIKVLRGEISQVQPSCNSLAGAVVKTDDVAKVEQTVELPPSIEAPITSGQQVGKIILSVEGKEIISYPITVQKSVAKLNFFRSLWLLTKGLLLL